MGGLSVKKEITIAYVASCVTLTCTMATMIDFTVPASRQVFSFRAPIIQPQETVPFVWLRQIPPSQHLLSARRFRGGRYNNKLAIGGLLV